MVTLHVVADSISMHYGPYLNKYISHWCKYSRKESKIGKLENPEGVNGGDSSMVLTYLRRCIDQNFPCDILVLNCGLHDIRSFNGCNQVEIRQYEMNLINIYDCASQISPYIIWARTTPVEDELHNSIKKDFKRFNNDVEKYNVVADKQASLHATRIIDLYNFCRNIGGPENYLDHIHFTEEMRKLQGAFVAGHIVAFIQSCPDLT